MTSGGEVVDRLLSRISRVGDMVQTSGNLKILVYGWPGVGKTVFAATAPNPLVADIEGGAYSISNHSNLSGVSRLEYASVNQIDYLLDSFKKGHFEEFDTLVIDSLSHLSRLDLDNVTQAAASTSANRDPFIPQLQDYKQNTNHMRKIVSDLVEIGRTKNVVCTSAVKEEKDEYSGRVRMRPDLTPQLAATIESLFDVVGFMSIDTKGDKIRKLQIQPSETIKAKTRVGGLPPVIENPTFSSFLN